VLVGSSETVLVEHRSDEDDFGIVRKIAGRWRDRPVKVEPTLPDGSLGPLQLVARLEYLVEWMPTAGPRRNKPWPLQREPASNLSTATTEIDAFEKEATAAHQGRAGPAKWILPDYRKKAPRDHDSCNDWRGNCCRCRSAWR